MEIKLRNTANKTIENNRAITLIALVITIIVLLILAGVTIATLTGDNGLLQKATNAKETSIDAEICEKIKLAYADYQTDQYRNIVYTYKEALESIFGQGNIEKLSEKKDNYIIKIKNSNKEYYYNKNTGESGEYTYVDPFNYGSKTKENLAKGDEITLHQDTVTESFTVLSNSTDKITIIPKYNITLTENHPIQSSTAERTEFSTRPYWSRDENDKEIPGWNSGAVDNIVDINMDNEANKIQKYIIAYKKTLEDMGVEGLEVRAVKYSDVSATGITNEMRNPGKTGTFWLGSGSSVNSSCPILLDNNGNFLNNYYYGNSRGVRPLIIINK